MRSLIAFLALVVAAAPPALAGVASDEIPGPGVKIERGTVGSTPQSLTAAEREKLARMQASTRVTPRARVTHALSPKAPPVATIGHGPRDASPAKAAKRGRLAGAAKRPAATGSGVRR